MSETCNRSPVVDTTTEASGFIFILKESSKEFAQGGLHVRHMQSTSSVEHNDRQLEKNQESGNSCFTDKES